MVGPEGEINAHTHLPSEQTFDQALVDLIRHANQRYQAASDYLESLR